MSNVSINKSRRLFLPGRLQGHSLYPTQGLEEFYAMVGVTRDTNGRVGAFTAGEKLVGLTHSNVQNKEYIKGTAGQAGFDVPVFDRGVLMVKISGQAFDDIGRAVFMSDNNTFTFNPVKGCYLGKTIFFDIKTSELGVELNPGAEQWDSWWDLAAAGTVDLPDASGAIVHIVGGDHSGCASIESDGTVTIHYTTSGGVTTTGSGAGAITIADAGTDVRITNNSGASLRVCVRYFGSQI